MGLDDYLKRFKEEGELMNSEVMPEDKDVFRENIRNTAVNKLGLPENWRSSLADEKSFVQDAPMAMAMGGLGANGKAAGFGATKVIPSLEQTLAQKGVGRVLNSAGQEMKSVGPNAIRDAAAPELVALQAQKATMGSGVYDAQKQAIFNRIRTMLGEK